MYSFGHVCIKDGAGLAEAHPGELSVAVAPLGRLRNHGDVLLRQLGHRIGGHLGNPQDPRGVQP
eukprot:scaffold507384_cov39-Prasinocladus_malaysianus.AAC.1